MKNCRKISESLEEYLLGGLASNERALVDVHLEKCPACRGAFNEHLAIHEALAGVEIKVPEDLAQNALAQIDAWERRTRAPWKVSAIAAVLLVFVAAAFVASSLFDVKGALASIDVPFTISITADAFKPESALSLVPDVGASFKPALSAVSASMEEIPEPGLLAVIAGIAALALSILGTTCHIRRNAGKEKNHA